MYPLARIVGLSSVLVSGIAAIAIVQRPAAPAGTSAAAQADVTARLAASAQALLSTLGEADRDKVQFPFDGPQKTRWSNLPGPMFQRRGLRLADVTPPQRAAV